MIPTKLPPLPSSRPGSTALPPPSREGKPPLPGSSRQKLRKGSVESSLGGAAQFQHLPHSREGSRTSSRAAGPASSSPPRRGTSPLLTTGGGTDVNTPPPHPYGGIPPTPGTPSGFSALKRDRVSSADVRKAESYVSKVQNRVLSTVAGVSLKSSPGRSLMQEKLEEHRLKYSLDPAGPRMIGGTTITSLKSPQSTVALLEDSGREMINLLALSSPPRAQRGIMEGEEVRDGALSSLLYQGTNRHLGDLAEEDQEEDAAIRQLRQEYEGEDEDDFEGDVTNLSPYRDGGSRGAEEDGGTLVVIEGEGTFEAGDAPPVVFEDWWHEQIHRIQSKPGAILPALAPPSTVGSSRPTSTASTTNFVGMARPGSNSSTAAPRVLGSREGGGEGVRKNHASSGASGKLGTLRGPNGKKLTMGERVLFLHPARLNTPQRALCSKPPPVHSSPTTPSSELMLDDGEIVSQQDLQLTRELGSETSPEKQHERLQLLRSKITDAKRVEDRSSDVFTATILSSFSGSVVKMSGTKRMAWFCEEIGLKSSILAGLVVAQAAQRPRGSSDKGSKCRAITVFHSSSSSHAPPPESTSKHRNYNNSTIVQSTIWTESQALVLSAAAADQLILRGSIGQSVATLLLSSSPRRGGGDRSPSAMNETSAASPTDHHHGLSAADEEIFDQHDCHLKNKQFDEKDPPLSVNAIGSYLLGASTPNVATQSKSTSTALSGLVVGTAGRSKLGKELLSRTLNVPVASTGGGGMKIRTQNEQHESSTGAAESSSRNDLGKQLLSFF